MVKSKHFRFEYISAFLCLMYTCVSIGQEILVQGGSEALKLALENAVAGDVLQLAPGVYRGNFVIYRPLKILGGDKVVLDGGGQGDVLRVKAEHTTIQGLRIQHSGMNLTQMNAGIFVEPQAKNVIISGNELHENAFGIWLDGCGEPTIHDNRISADPRVRSQDRGNGIHLYAVKNGIIRDNEIWNVRDGIYIDTSQENLLQGNVMHDLRYGIHYMYSYSNRVEDNYTYHTRTGYALMQSKYLTVLNNRSEQDQNYGILMNFITNSTIRGNEVTQVREGTGYAIGGSGVAGAEGKAIFIYNSQFNEISDNRFSQSDLGIHITAGSEDNRFTGNDFESNRVQVKYVANRLQEWSHEGRGNYWSDYLGWDLDANGVGDKPYEPNDAVDKLLWKYPLARILMSSPAIETLRWVQEQFPVLRPQGVRDSFPLMSNTGQRQGGS